MKSDSLPNERFREWLEGVNNRTRQPYADMNRHQTASEKAEQGRGRALSPSSDEHKTCEKGTGNAIVNLGDVGNTARNAPQGQEIDGKILANGSKVTSKTHSSATNRGSTTEDGDRNAEMNNKTLQSGISTINLSRSGILHSTRQILNSNNIEEEIQSNSDELNAIQGGYFNLGINGIANADHNVNGLAVGLRHAASPHTEEIDPNIPAWASATPLDGYIMHPVAGLVMHPSFYDNRHLIELATQPRYIYDGEVDGPLCPVGKKCDHFKNCFEVRVRMAVFAYQRHHISFRDAEYIWSVSRSTIQRRKAAMEKQSTIIFLITPEHTGE